MESICPVGGRTLSDSFDSEISESFFADMIDLAARDGPSEFRWTVGTVDHATFAGRTGKPFRRGRRSRRGWPGRTSHPYSQRLQGASRNSARREAPARRPVGGRSPREAAHPRSACDRPAIAMIASPDFSFREIDARGLGVLKHPEPWVRDEASPAAAERRRRRNAKPSPDCVLDAPIGRVSDAKTKPRSES
jgi:hypothetical protein